MDIQSPPKSRKWQVVYLVFLCYWDWASGQFRYSIAEETEPGTIVGNLAQDLGLNLADIPKRRLHLGSEGSKRHFTVNQKSGALIVKEIIDRESLCGSSISCSLHIEVVAENPSELFSLEIDILDINDNSPTFSRAFYTVRITELLEITGARYPLETAKDLDVGINSINKYLINSNPYFSLSVKNRKDGILIPELILEKALDREEKEEHRLILTAFDGGEQPKSGSCQITILVLDINDNAPVFDQPSYKIHLIENSSYSTAIIALHATDLDNGLNSEIEYAFDDSTPDSVRELFDLNAHTGEIYISGVLDFEESNFYELSIKAKDKGVPAMVGRCLVQIEVEDTNDNPPELFFTLITNEVSEAAALGTVIGFLSVKDRDSGKNGQVQLKVSPNLPFQFKPVKNHYSLVTSGFLDRENVSQFTIQLIATDLGSPPLQTEIQTILTVSDINDNPPVFNKPLYNAFINENNEPGSLLCTVSAFDLDDGENAELIYNVVETQIDGSSITSFVYINQKNGNLYAQRAFDYEHIQVFHITVRVEDCGFPKLSSNVSVSIFVLDTNDNHPIVLYPEISKEPIVQEKISWSASVHYLVTKVSAVDLDSGYNAWLQYNLIEETDSTLFQISAYTGEIRILRGLQETDNIEQQVVILISDHGEPSLSTTVTLLVNIVDSIVQESPKSIDFLSHNHHASDLTLYLIISLVAVSLVSLITFIILFVKCFKSEHHDRTSICSFLNRAQSKKCTERCQPTLYLNTDGTLKYMEVRMVPPEPQGLCYQTCFPPETEKHDFSLKKSLHVPHLNDAVNEIEASLDASWINDPPKVRHH